MAFASEATDLAGPVINTNAAQDALLFDREIGSLTLISQAPGGTSTANRLSAPWRMSADGSVVTLVSDATNLVPPGVDLNSTADTFVFHNAIR